MLKILALHKKYPLFIFFAAAFLIWILSFRDFVFKPVHLQSDALSYYENISYYIRNLLIGVYPMWNPFFAEGVPNEFFLRRVGSFNPLLLLMAVLYKMGAPQSMSFTLSLSIYYFVGAIGFYLLAKFILRDRRIAFTAFLLLYFSALGTRLFDSYILLVIIPMMWFFYFFCTFCTKPQRHLCLGLLFCLMIIFTTYIPFYFVTIFLIFLICYAFFYGNTVSHILKRVGEFIRQNKLFVGFCLGIFLIALLPGIFLYREASQGGFVLPARHGNAGSLNAIEVGRHWIDWWAILEDLVFSKHFLREITEYEFAIFYIPLFGCIIFFLTLVTGITKRLAFLFFWGLLLFLIGTPHTPIYNFFYDKVFFFKYFRNLHFFLWMALLPISILILAELFQNLLAWIDRTTKKRMPVFFVFIAIAHIFIWSYFFIQHHELISTYVVIGASFLFFSLYQFFPKLADKFSLCLLLVAVVAQPFQVYQYLKENRILEVASYETPHYYTFLYFEAPGIEENIEEFKKMGKEYRAPPPGAGNKIIYYGLPWFGFLYANMNSDIYEGYINYSIHFYDQVTRLENKDLDIRKFETVIAQHYNVAVVSADYNGPEYYGNPRTFSKQSGVLPADTEEFKVARFNANEVIFNTNLKQPKFVVYNDNFDKSWHGFIDGKEMDIYRANIAFKGFWVPAGTHTVHLRYGEMWKYLFNVGMLILFMAVLISLILSSLKASRLSYGK